MYTSNTALPQPVDEEQQQCQGQDGSHGGGNHAESQVRGGIPTIRYLGKHVVQADEVAA